MSKSLDEMISSAVAKTGVAAPMEQTPPAPVDGRSQQASQEPAPPVADDKELEGLTPNLRRIKASLGEKITEMDPKAQKVVLERVAEVEKAMHQDKASYAETKRFVDQIVQAGITLEDLKQVAESKRMPKPATQAVASEALKTSRGLAKLMSGATTPEQREAIRELQVSIQEEFEDLQKAHPKDGQLAETVNRLERLLTTSRSQSVESEIDAMEAEYPSSLIEKYRPAIKRAALMQEFAGVSVEDILYKLAPAKEIKESREHLSKSTQPKREPVASVSSARSSEEDTKQFKRPDGTWNLHGIIQQAAKRVGR